MVSHPITKVFSPYDGYIQRLAMCCERITCKLKFWSREN